MARNVEIKARVSDPAAMRARVRSVTRAAPEVIVQCDTFFRTARGRLKLREMEDRPAELIFYERPDEAGPKTSVYSVTPVADPAGIRELLGRACGAVGVVSKRREVSLAGATRIHLDHVDGLGWFLELEVVLSESQSEAEGERMAAELMNRLGLGPGDLVPGAYLDLIRGAS